MAEKVITPAHSGRTEFRINGGEWKYAKPAVIEGKKETAEELGATFEQRTVGAVKAVTALVSDYSGEPADNHLTRTIKGSKAGRKTLDLTTEEFDQMVRGEIVPEWQDAVVYDPESDEAVLTRAIRLWAKAQGLPVADKGQVSKEIRAQFTTTTDQDERVEFLQAARNMVGMNETDE